MSQSDTGRDVCPSRIRPPVGKDIGHCREHVAVDEPQGIEIEPSSDSAH
jgi:hypothetical protein